MNRLSTNKQFSISGLPVRLRRRAIKLMSVATLAFLPCGVLANNPAFEKVALIIGNSDYSEMPDLPNATNDAAAVSDMLEASGYLVFTKTDVTKKEFGESIADISASLNETSEVVFFFAGHGFQIGSENYLIPTDSEISDLADIPLESISLTHVLEHFATVSGAQVVLLDSCRNNPFIGQQAYNGLGTEQLTIQNGFSFQSAPVNSLISFSTAPGSLALDGEGDNSPYTMSLIDATAANPTTDIASLLPIMRAQVFEETQGYQVPWESSSLLKPVYLGLQPDATEQEQLVAALQVPKDRVLTPEQPTQDTRLALAGLVQRHVPLFSSDATRGFDASADLTIETAPQNGWLGLMDGQSLRTVRAGDVIPGADVARLTYAPNLRNQAKTRGLRAVSDFLEIRRGDSKVAVDVTLTYHDCDIAAASPSDSQGTGLAVVNARVDPDAAAAACANAVAEFPNEGRFHYQRARAQIAQLDFEGAETSLKTALELGHIRAHAGFGQLKLIQTRGVAADNTQPVTDDVLQTYIDGHLAGDVLGTYLLGRQLIRHGDMAADRERGFALLHRAKDAGYHEALNELGRYFLVSKGADANPVRGEQYFLESAKRDNLHAHNSLGIIYKDGVGGIPVSLDKAVKHFQIATDLNHPTAPSSLGRIWSEGKLVSPDFSQALTWYDKGLSRGDPWGGTNGANLIILGKIPSKSKFEAAARLAKAATIGAGSARRAALALQDKLTKKELAGGLQFLLSELGQDISVDGITGSQTERAIIDVYGALVPLRTQDDVKYALERVAEVYWDRSNVRRDLN